MKILILITKDKRQLLKLVQYNKLKKKAKAKISRLNQDFNRTKYKGNIKEKFDFIQIIYKKKKEINLEDDIFSKMIYIKPYINGVFYFFNMEKAKISENYLELEYHKHIKENKHQVLEYNITNKNEPKGSKIFDEILNYVEKIGD